MRKTIVAMFALAAVGLAQPTVGSARAGVGGYPASFGGDYAEGGGELPPGSASRHDAPRLANTASSGLQLIEDTSQPAHIAGLVELGPKAKSK